MVPWLSIFRAFLILYWFSRHGGKTSHAAVIARGMGAPCVCGVEALKIDAAKKEAAIAGTDLVIREGDMISIDGTTGIVVLGAVDLVMPELTGDLDTILEWADEVRTLGVRANADNPEDAQLSRDFGAEGIGLCRTEHMFLGDRKQIIQTFILNDDELIREKAVADLFEAQVGDFYGMFKAMDLSLIHILMGEGNREIGEIIPYN